MKHNFFKSVLTLSVLFFLSLLGASNLRAQDDSHKGHEHGHDASQKSAASKSATFGTVAKTDKAYTSAIDAHDKSGASKMSGQDGSFRGKVAKLYTPRSGGVLILNFDDDYKSAITAVLKKDDFSKFPDMSQLDGKEIVVSGKFSDFKGSPEIVLTDPKQIAIVK